jgi:ribonuclease HI
MTGIFCTVNSDAGYLSFAKVGSFAYWIKGGGMHIHHSGLFKEKCDGSWQAEMQAIINALHHLKKVNTQPIIGFIFNSDCKFARPGPKGHKHRQVLQKLIKEFKDDAREKLGKEEFKRVMKNIKEYAIFRHVKAHEHTDTKRNWVNDWADRQCKARLREWLKEYYKNKHEAI